MLVSGSVFADVLPGDGQSGAVAGMEHVEGTRGGGGRGSACAQGESHCVSLVLVLGIWRRRLQHGG